VVEGGAGILGAFFETGLVDEVMAFVAPKLVGAGVGVLSGWSADEISQALRLEGARVRSSGSDALITGRVVYSR